MKTKIAVCVPIHRVWSKESFEHFADCVDASKYCEVISLFKLYEESLIQRARNNLINSFLSSKADVMFCLDDDIVLFQQNTLDMMVQSLGQDGVDIVSAPVVTKRPPFKPNYFPLNGEDYPDTRNRTDLIRVQYVSTACTMYSRKVCEAVKEEWKYPFDCYETKVSDRHGHVYLSEDWAFCDRADRLGYRSFIDPRITVGHLGLYAYSMDDFYRMNNLENKG